MGKKSAPAPIPPPDPNVVSGAQTQSNKDTAAYNAALGSGSTFTPLGSSTFTSRIDPNTGAPVYDQTISLSPDQQSLLDMQSGQQIRRSALADQTLGQVAANTATPFSLNGLPELQSGNLSTRINAGNLPDVAAGGLRTDVGASNLPALPGANDLMGARREAQDALYGRQTAYLDPQWQQAEEQTRTRLINQGVPEGSEAWNNAMGDLARKKEFAYGQARDSAIAGATGELGNLSGIAHGNRAQLYGEALQNANFGNNAVMGNADLASRARSQLFDEASQQANFGNAATATNADLANRARSQGMSELFALRNQPLQEYMALSGGAAPQIPNFQGNQATGANPTNVAGDIWAAYQGQQANNNAQTASANANMQGLYSLGSAALMAAMLSDRRAKWAIRRIGTTRGLPAYAYRYIGSDDWHVGVMAQDVQDVRPDAVVDIGGLLHVRYGVL